MATLLKPKNKKRATSLALSSDLLKKLEDLSRGTKRSKSELAETFIELGLEAFEKERDTDALVYDARREESDVLLQDCTELLRRLKSLSKK